MGGCSIFIKKFDQNIFQTFILQCFVYSYPSKTVQLCFKSTQGKIWIYDYPHNDYSLSSSKGEVCPK